MYGRVVVYVAALLLLAVVAGVVTWRLLGTSSPYEQAFHTLPAETLRSTYTDWGHVRTAAGGSGLGSTSSKASITSWLGRAYDRDLTAGSAIAESTFALRERFGFSPLDAEWEAFGQGREGQVDVLRLPDDVDLDGVEGTLRKLGYTAPRGGAGSGGTWVGGVDLVAQIDSELTPVQQNIVVLPDDHLVLMSDNAAFASSAAEVIDGSADSLADQDGVSELAAAANEAVAAVQWASTFACEDLSMGAADEGDQSTGERLVQEAGDISPVEGLVMAQRADRSLVLGMHFETSDAASRNLQSRVDLASGEAPGQGGTFAERFELASGEADGSDVVITTDPVSKDAAVLSDLSSGPVLFATC